jgi:MFS family permease
MSGASQTTPRIRIDKIPLTLPQAIFLGLLVLSICINYIDRGSLAVGGKMVADELHLDAEQLGRLFSAFFWTYAMLQIPAGWLVDRYNVNWIYGAGFAIWSAATLFTGLSHGFLLLMAMRLLLGVGESVAYPSYSRILAANFREHQRGLANALIDAGSKAGPALGVLLGGKVMALYGWRSFFILVGAVSLLWIIPWMIWSPHPSSMPARHATNSPSIAQILSKRSAWGTFLGLLCSNYAWYFIAFWIPVYFRDERHFSQNDLAIIGQIPFWGIVAGTLVGGTLSDMLIATGFTPTLVRKSCACLGLGLCAVTMVPAALAPDIRITLVLLTASGFFFGFISSNVWAITQTLAGPLAAGQWTGIQNFIGNIPGMFGLWFTGWLIKQSGGHYLPAFYVAAGFALAGVVAFGLMVQRVEPVDWKEFKIPNS